MRVSMASLKYVSGPGGRLGKLHGPQPYADTLFSWRDVSESEDEDQEPEIKVENWIAEANIRNGVHLEAEV